MKAHFHKLASSVGLPREVEFYVKLAERAYSKLLSNKS